ncbi:MAG: septum formation initiator family protein [Varibaculum cambriense]|uniref:FtsB family cell division protein n=1 Tax=Varibaculum cambriense TaxID=184870 RepID=UPI0029012B8F|nr:septum formation initiator family protein [Varibaculum cambriense]MDU1050786.1 septum formation initiator family protein [Varibaculum cambriense]
MKSPQPPKSVQRENTRKQGSAFRSVSPLVRTAKRNRGRSPMVKAANRRVKVGSRFSVTVGSILVVASIFLLLVGAPLFDLVSQLEQRNKVHAQLVAAKQENRELHKELELWDNSDYLTQQARERLGYVKPGETRYAVVDPGKDYQARQEAKLEKLPARPWYLEVTHSVKMAGQSTASKESSTQTRPQPAPGATPEQEKAKKK